MMNSVKLIGYNVTQYLGLTLHDVTLKLEIIIVFFTLELLSSKRWHKHWCTGLDSAQVELH